VAPFWRTGLAMKSRIKQSDALLRGTRFMHRLISRQAAA
jgi:hypothetical protein